MRLERAHRTGIEAVLGVPKRTAIVKFYRVTSAVQLCELYACCAYSTLALSQSDYIGVLNFSFYGYYYDANSPRSNESNLIGVRTK